MFKLKISNFRSFEDQTFDFSKFNILIGENSSGKSSIFKFLLALKQTLESPNNKETNLAFSGEYADLGNYIESVYYHNDALPISFCFGFDERYKDFYINSFSLDEGESTSETPLNLDKIVGEELKSTVYITYSLTSELDNHASIITKFHSDDIGELTIKHSVSRESNDKKLIFGSFCSLVFLDKLTEVEYKLEKIKFDKDGFMSMINSVDLIERIEKDFGKMHASPFEIDLLAEVDSGNISATLFHKIGYLLVAQNYLKYILDKIDYINPINTTPARFYMNRDKRSLHNISNIEDVVDFFSRSNEFSKAALKDFVKILKALGLADDIDILKDDRLPVREIRVKVKDLLSNIKDVGYGVSLQMPIILKALLADRIDSNKNSLILIEQPEVHLHPKLHARLIEALVLMSRQSIYFIETHSEHVVRKLQVLAKDNNQISSNDITIHYLKRLETRTEVTYHKIDKNGLLTPPFPSGFFDTSYLLAKELLD